MDEEMLAILRVLRVSDPCAYETIRLLAKKALEFSPPQPQTQPVVAQGSKPIPAPPKSRESQP